MSSARAVQAVPRLSAFPPEGMLRERKPVSPSCESTKLKNLSESSEVALESSREVTFPVRRIMNCNRKKPVFLFIVLVLSAAHLPDALLFL